MIEEIAFYIYALVDPNTNLPFYIGKGYGQRVFSHQNDPNFDNIPSDKIQKIRDIESNSQTVRRIIIRHGMTEKESFIAEAVLIDFFRFFNFGLTNIASGHHSQVFGIMSVEEIQRRYMAPPLEKLGEGCIIININRSYREARKRGEGFYEATRGTWNVERGTWNVERGTWKIAGHRTNSIKFALAEYTGFVVEVFEVHSWESVEDRYKFTGVPANEEIRKLYINRRVPKNRGAANPISYRLQVLSGK